MHLTFVNDISAYLADGSVNQAFDKNVLFPSTFL